MRTDQKDFESLLSSENKFRTKNRLVTSYFVGRNEELAEFYRLFQHRSQKNVLHVVGKEGLGKSWLLRKIFQDNREVKIARRLVEIIDFRETEHQSIRGVCNTIVSLLGARYFKNFLDEQARTLKSMRGSRTTSTRASKKNWIESQFYADLNKACLGREVVLLFDSFDVVQNSEVGTWFISEFLENTNNLIVIFAGRPKKPELKTPFRAIRIQLKPFNLFEVEEFFRSQSARFGFDLGEVSLREIERIYLQAKRSQTFQEDKSTNFNFIDYLVTTHRNLLALPLRTRGKKQSKNPVLKDDNMVIKSRNPKVFISYSHSDSGFVDYLAKQLQKMDVDVWIDKWMIKVGDSITEKVNEGIKSSDYLITVLSKASVVSKWVKEELNAALINNVEQDKRAYILPALIEDCEIPSLLKHRKYANFIKNKKEGLQELADALHLKVK